MELINEIDASISMKNMYVAYKFILNTLSFPQFDSKCHYK